MNFIPLVGRVLFALIFVLAGPGHFTRERIAHAAALGVPLANVLVPLSGILALARGLSLAFGFHARWGAWALVVFLVPVTLAMHPFWTIADPAQRQVQLIMFLKKRASRLEHSDLTAHPRLALRSDRASAGAPL